MLREMALTLYTSATGAQQARWVYQPISNDSFVQEEMSDESHWDIHAAATPAPRE